MWRSNTQQVCRDGILNDFEYCVRDEKDRDMLLEEENDTVCLKKIKYLIDAPQGFDVYVNGKKLDRKYLKETGVEVDELKYIPEKYVEKPTYDRYEVAVLIVPEVVVKNNDGFEVTTKTDNEKQWRDSRCPRTLHKSTTQ